MQTNSSDEETVPNKGMWGDDTSQQQVLGAFQPPLCLVLAASCSVLVLAKQRNRAAGKCKPLPFPLKIFSMSSESSGGPDANWPSNDRPRTRDQKLSAARSGWPVLVPNGAGRCSASMGLGYSRERSCSGGTRLPSPRNDLRLESDLLPAATTLTREVVSSSGASWSPRLSCLAQMHPTETISERRLPLWPPLVRLSFPGTPCSSFVWLGQQSPKPWRHSTTPYLIAWPPCTPFQKRLEWLDPLGNASDLPILLSSGPRPRLVDGGTSSHCPQRGAVVWHESQPRRQNDRQDAAEVLRRTGPYYGNKPFEMRGVEWLNICCCTQLEELDRHRKLPDG
ncbi:hypothetical protein TgHK011_003833 [Trichoderma gracile]|nr:hypothetical protein TgHK011_003833 [Trichoderma gracile]